MPATRTTGPALLRFLAGAGVAASVLLGTGPAAPGAPGVQAAAVRADHEHGWYAGYDAQDHPVQLYVHRHHVSDFWAGSNELGTAPIEGGGFQACHAGGCFAGHWRDSTTIVGAWKLQGHRVHHFLVNAGL